MGLRFDARLRALAAGLAICGLGGQALADPCEAVPDRGPTPAALRPGTTFSGPVVYVADGDSLCVAAEPGDARNPRTWVEVRLANFYAPELKTAEGRRAKAVLARVAQGKRATCRAGRRSYDRIVADCRLGTRSIGEVMRAWGIREGGRGRE